MSESGNSISTTDTQQKKNKKQNYSLQLEKVQSKGL